MTDTDPIRAYAAKRKPPTYRLPEYLRPAFTNPAPIPVESLTPGTGTRTDPTVADAFNTFMRDQLDGAYGSTSGWQ